MLAVDRQGTLAAAGRGLKVDATTVGRRILAVESALGSRLFDRTADGYRATHTGRLPVARAEEVERATTALAREVGGSDSRVEGPVRLTALDAMFDKLIIPRLPVLAARHPRRELTFSSDLDLLDLSRSEADVALRPRRPTHPDSVGRRLGRAAMGAYAVVGLDPGPSPPLVGLPVRMDDSTFTRFQRRLFPDGRLVVRGNSESHILALTRAGLGVGLLDCFVGDADPSLRRFLPDPVDMYDVWAETHVAMARVPRVRAVTDFMAEIFAAEADLIAGLRPLVTGSGQMPLS